MKKNARKSYDTTTLNSVVDRIKSVNIHKNLTPQRVKQRVGLRAAGIKHTADAIMRIRMVGSRAVDPVLLGFAFISPLESGLNRINFEEKTEKM